jgi:spore coat protein CotF
MLIVKNFSLCLHKLKVQTNKSKTRVFRGVIQNNIPDKSPITLACDSLFRR